MAEPSIPDFLELLGNSRLLTDAQLESLRKQIDAKPQSAASLAKTLVRQSHLTEWQARQLLKGQAGFVLNHYRLLNPIGRGGMGHVFRGLDAKTNDVVAVKVMARKLTSNQTLVSRFRREIRATSRLNSPYVVRTLDAGRVGKVDFMVMEFVNGDQLDRIANRLGRVPVGLACEIVRQVAEGLQHAHDHEMVHRDIKPPNIMVHWDESGHGTAKLMDMGLVLMMSDDITEQSVTRAGQVMGTPDYMSPEQGWDTTKVDIRSDIYSLGCTLFRMLTGKIPFTGSNPLQVLSQRLQRDAPSVLTVCDDIPEAVAAVVSKMTRRDPNERYQTPAEVAAALREFGEPLERQAFQIAAQLATNDPDADISEPKSDEDVDEADFSYRQFLTEVESGSAVNLMLTTDSNIDVSSATLPALDLNVEPESPLHKRTRTGPKRGQKAGVVVMIVSVIVIACAAAFVMFRDTDTLVAGSNNSGKSKAVESSSGRFLQLEPPPATAGETWTFKPETEIKAKSGAVVIQLGDSAPDGMQVDESTGELNWEVPIDKAPGAYAFTLSMLHEFSGKKKTLSETELTVHVMAGTVPVKMADDRTFQLDAESPFITSVAVPPSIISNKALSYQFVGEPPRTLRLDRENGTLEWKPRVRDLGRHDVTVAVFDGDSTKPLDQQTLTLLVLPSKIDHVLPRLPQQSATAGMPFRYRFPAPVLARAPQVEASRMIGLTDASPEGMEVSTDGRELIWDVPMDAAGIVEVPLTASLQFPRGGRSLKLNGTAILKIDVTSASPTAVPNTLPDADAIAAALAEVRETYKSRLAAARTSAQRMTLARQFMELTTHAKPGPGDAALLQLIEEDLATRSRAIDVLFDVAQIRAARYGIEETATSQQIVDLFRRTALDADQQDRTVEHALRLAHQTATNNNYELAAGLLDIANSLLRGTAGQGPAAMLSGDAAEAAKLAQELSRSAEGATSEIKRKELIRLLDRWQFEPVFQSTDGLNFFTVAQTGTSQLNSRDFWKIRDGLISLEGVTQQAAVGFLQPVETSDRFVVRFEVLPATTSIQFIFGAQGTGQTDFIAFGAILDSTAPGRIMDIRNRTTVADPNTTARLHTDRANSAEVVVDGPNVAARMNGMTISQAQIPELTPGKIGLSANFGTPEPKVAIRNMRILWLPAAQ